jgi:putative ABC transport system permease protein
MFRQSFYIIFRRFFKDPVFSLITLSNLALGFATFIILAQFLNTMRNWDKHNLNYDRIYRVQLFQDQKENVVSHSSSITAALSRNDLPRLAGVEKIVLMHDVGDNNKDGVFLSVDRKNEIIVRYGYYSDQTVFDVFTFHFIEGDPSQALTRPNTIVLSKSVADKLFPDGQATGKQMYAENKVVLTVTGVYENIPQSSTWQPSFLLPMLSFTEFTGWKDYENNYWAYSFFTYVLLKPNANPADVDNKIHDALKNYNKDHYPYLRPMSQLYFRPYFEKDYMVAVALFLFTAILILTLSSINYINLQTANASTRFREIGIKKAVGFSRRQLWYQFMLESVGLALLGGLIGVLIAHLSYPAFNQMIQANIITSIFSDWKLLTFVLLVSLVTGFLSGLYPAYAISKFNPVSALKQKLVQAETNGISLKKVLVTLQFSISIFLLASGFIIYRQTYHMVHFNMGFNSEQVMFANIITDKKGSFNALREQLLKHPEIADASVSDYIPFVLPGGDELNWEGASDPEEQVFVRFYNVSYDYLNTWDMKIVEGRNFSRDYPGDAEKCILNETAVKVFGWKDPIGHRIKIWNKNYEVIGIVKDYVAFSVHNKLEPHLLKLLPDSIHSDNIYAVRFVPGQEKEARETVKQEFDNFFPDDAYEFKNIQYRIRTENAVKEWGKLMKISVLFAFCSIIISSIGLFGLMLFYTRHRLKEIGIRKVLGFSYGHLYFNMSSEFLRLLMVSILVAWPAAYYVYIKLPGAHKYHLQAWEFIIATMITLTVAMLTISYQIMKALKTRPVEILKDE